MGAVRQLSVLRWVVLPGLFCEQEAQAAHTLGWRVRPLVIIDGETYSVVDMPDDEPRAARESFPDCDTGVVAKGARG